MSKGESGKGHLPHRPSLRCATMPSSDLLGGGAFLLSPRRPSVCWSQPRGKKPSPHLLGAVDLPFPAIPAAPFVRFLVQSRGAQHLRKIQVGTPDVVGSRSPTSGCCTTKGLLAQCYVALFSPITMSRLENRSQKPRGEACWWPCPEGGTQFGMGFRCFKHIV